MYVEYHGLMLSAAIDCVMMTDRLASLCGQQSNPGLVASQLDLGFIPILHGDVVFDETKGCNILSGDTIIRTLAREVPGVKRVRGKAMLSNREGEGYACQKAEL